MSDAQLDRDTVYLISPYGRRRLPQDSDRPTATTAPAPSLTPDYDGDDDEFGYIGEAEGKKRRKGSNCVKKNLKRFMAAVQHAPRPHLRRNSPVSAFPSSHGYTSNAPSAANKRFDVSDSDSDDEPPPAIKFSKVTEALLNNGSTLR